MQGGAATNVSVPLRNLFVFTKACLSHAGLRLVSLSLTTKVVFFFLRNGLSEKSGTV